MPNWCKGELIVSGSSLELAKFTEYAKRNGAVLSAEKFIPCPRKDTGFDGNNWARQNWGTKWDICDAEIVENDSKTGKVTYKFDTAWSPCRPVVMAMATQFPALKFEYNFFEPGAGFKGILVCEAGKPALDKVWACVGYTADAGFY